MTTAIVVGYGSIGRRHTRILLELGCHVGVVSRRKIDHQPSFTSISEAMQAMRGDYVVVANETWAHGGTINDLISTQFRGRVLIEKPLGAAAFPEVFELCAVAYNLRFHPVLIALGEALKGEQIVSTEIYCGQYLPDWRPDTNYRDGYSADRARGGGVLRDLSHELDYLQLFCGTTKRVAAIGGRFGALDISSDDCQALLLELERCRCATVQLNYLDRPGRREIIINTMRHTFAADINKSVLQRDGRTEHFRTERDETYRAEHIAMLAGDKSRLCSIKEGESIMRLIDAIEQASDANMWVQL